MLTVAVWGCFCNYRNQEHVSVKRYKPHLTCKIIKLQIPFSQDDVFKLRIPPADFNASAVTGFLVVLLCFIKTAFTYSLKMYKRAGDKLAFFLRYTKVANKAMVGRWSDLCKPGGFFYCCNSNGHQAPPFFTWSNLPFSPQFGIASLLSDHFPSADHTILQYMVLLVAWGYLRHWVEQIQR